MNNSEKAAILREIAKAYRRWGEVQESADQKSPEFERATKEAHALAILHYDLLTDVFRNRKLPGPLRKVLDIHLYRWHNNEQVIWDPLSEWEWFTQPISSDSTSFPEELERCAGLIEKLPVEDSKSAPDTSSTSPVEWSRPMQTDKLAVIFGVHKNTMSSWLKNQTIQNEKIGKLHRVAISELPADAVNRVRKTPQ